MEAHLAEERVRIDAWKLEAANAWYNLAIQRRNNFLQALKCRIPLSECLHTAFYNIHITKPLYLFHVKLSHFFKAGVRVSRTKSYCSCIILDQNFG